MRGLVERVLETIRKSGLIRAGDRLAVAVSGGADSVALLLLLLELRGELGIVLSVAHVNHKLRGAESDEDQRFVADLARRHDLELLARAAPVERQPASGIEAAARALRYDFFRELARAGRVGKIATAHTLDDQAETVLLRMFRGTGIRGLAGIHPRLILEEEGRAYGEVVRPLLEVRRADLQEFLRARGQEWREDSSNRDPNFLRNRVRLAVLPVLKETFGESAAENLADLAEIARAEEEHWGRGHPEVRAAEGDLKLASLSELPSAGQRRLVRSWLETNLGSRTVSFRLIADVLELAAGAVGRTLELPGGRILRRAQRELRWEAAEDQPADYEYVLPVPGSVEVCELGVRIEAFLTDWDLVPETERSHLLDPAKLTGPMRVRNWRPGERFWPANTRQPKKVKELLSNRHAVGIEKKLWPVIEAGGELVWMRGFAVPAAVQAARGASRPLWIREAGCDAKTVA
ncbi:MAG: tRNA lysidine(34) synthetase TilS [Acidobacteriia bacterium]|nr:tRNA lysidine(34) synthetase TilS [Terriglobia bacterium]